MDRTSINSKEIQADIETVWNAFTEKKALEYWLAPYGMTGKIHDFDLKVGGGYEMSLYYKDNKTQGKTSGNEDRFSATFTEIKPFERIVQTINFQSDNSKFKDEMTMQVQLDKLDTNSTKVTIIFRNIPTGIDPKDNEDGTEQSLQKLAKFIESK
ncbi:SRPBCC domain-containing protein [Phocaeicola vulgatus]|jgi:uncharacterized protein YndB with AHSA1/START domain|uniref:SRPBCC domain-containing protein n=1 Tax=Phocaeicola vulgatus TaxID=821 RepID=UPI001C2293C0|nr:SRPBCC domain-containing protein [Phocaeicola vulgatus]MBU9064584.1 SRPBCC domain-containing protein [Phocaeicola vulgatus]MBV3185139.1 SRPBCC domain-containing protein [Phocaeicola vulgatus]MBV3186349.1 SRPBCC domain-containing protein [Phocaeicola vulgatus]MBV3193562.1 SRPBCC domain-containing protein [Phocaeicola vulgatus]MBV3197206.1 SRPBCC domain-containing protein [Phocaeicola vulgatus]